MRSQDRQFRMGQFRMGWLGRRRGARGGAARGRSARRPRPGGRRPRAPGVRPARSSISPRAASQAWQRAAGATASSGREAGARTVDLGHGDRGVDVDHRVGVDLGQEPVQAHDLRPVRRLVARRRSWQAAMAAWSWYGSASPSVRASERLEQGDALLDRRPGPSGPGPDRRAAPGHRAASSRAGRRPSVSSSRASRASGQRVVRAPARRAGEPRRMASSQRSARTSDSARRRRGRRCRRGGRRRRRRPAGRAGPRRSGCGRGCRRSAIFCLGPDQPLGHGRLADEERPGHVGGRQAAQGPQRQRHPGVEVERRVAAGEDAGAAGRPAPPTGRAAPDRDDRPRRRVRFLVGAVDLSPHHVEGLASGGHVEPRAGVVRRAGPRPDLEGGHRASCTASSASCEVAGGPGEDGQDAAALDPGHLGEGIDRRAVTPSG